MVIRPLGKHLRSYHQSNKQHTCLPTAVFLLTVALSTLSIHNGRHPPTPLKARHFPHLSRTVPQCLLPRATVMLDPLPGFHLHHHQTTQAHGHLTGNTRPHAEAVVTTLPSLQSLVDTHPLQLRPMLVTRPLHKVHMAVLHFQGSAPPSNHLAPLLLGV